MAQQLAFSDTGMPAVSDLARMHTAPLFQLPLTLTPEYVSRLATMNQVSRRLRELGYQVEFEDAMPTDGSGCPLVCVKPGTARNERPIENLASSVTLDRVNHVKHAHIDGVRVQWRTPQ